MHEEIKFSLVVLFILSAEIVYFRYQVCQRDDFV